MTPKGLIDSFAVLMVLKMVVCPEGAGSHCALWLQLIWEIDKVEAYVNVYFSEGILIKLFLVKVIYFPYYEIMYFWTRF